MRVKYFGIEVVATPADGRTTPAVDAKIRVTMQQILSTIWQRSKAHKNGLFVRSGLSDFPFKLSLSITKALMFANSMVLALRFVQFYFTPSHQYLTGVTISVNRRITILERLVDLERAPDI
jgi:hypothetical protein